MKIWIRFREGGGLHLVKAFIRLGLLPDLMKLGFNVLLKGKIFRQEYAKLRHKVEPKLVKEFSSFLACNNKPTGKPAEKSHKDEGNEYVWFCWLQGIDKAPDIVKACLESQKKWLKGRTFVIVTAENYKEYISLPRFIEEKYAKKRIPNALFSDLIRVELLIKYGGTWIDSTVMITGDNYPAEIFGCQLFMPQYIGKNGTRQGISNWMITAKKGNHLLKLLKEMLLEYWRRYDCVVDYYIFHLFFEMIANKYPDEAAGMPILNSYHCIELFKHVGEHGQSDKLGRFLSKVSIHKLGHGLGKEILQDKENVLNELLRLQSENIEN